MGGFPAAAEEPPKLLKGFQKVLLAAGASTTVTLPLTAEAVSVFDLVSDDYLAMPGSYTVLVGSSSVDIRLTSTVTVTN